MNAGAFACLRKGDRLRLSNGWCGNYGRGVVCEVDRRVRTRAGFAWRLRVLYPSVGTRPRRPLAWAVTPDAWEHLTYTPYALHT